MTNLISANRSVKLQFCCIFKFFLKNSDGNKQMTSSKQTKLHIEFHFRILFESCCSLQTKIQWNYQNRAKNNEFIIRLPLGQIGQGQTPFLSGFMFWVWPIIILLASLVFLGCPKLIKKSVKKGNKITYKTFKLLPMRVMQYFVSSCKSLENIWSPFWSVPVHSGRKGWN